MRKLNLLFILLLLSSFSFGQTQSISYTRQNAGSSSSATISDITTCQLTAELYVYATGWDGVSWTDKSANIYINGSLAFSNVPHNTTLTTAQLAPYLPINNVVIQNTWSMWGFVQGILTIESDLNDVPDVPELSANYGNACASTNTTIPATTSGSGVALRYYWGDNLENYSLTSPTINIATPGIYNYWVSQVNASGCESERIKYSVIVGNPTNCEWLDYQQDNAGSGSNITITPSICATNEFLYIYATRFDGFDWLASSANLYINGSLIGTQTHDQIVDLTPYMPINSVQLVNTAGTWSYTFGHLMVSQDAAGMPAAPTVADVSYCLNETTVALTAGADVNNSLRWYSNDLGFNMSTTAPTPSSTTVGTTSYYVAQITPGGCESTRDVIDVTINDLPVVDAGTDAAFCQGTSVTLSGSGAQTYSWDNSVVDGVSFTPSATQTYTVIGTDVNGCENTDQITLTMNTLPVVDAGSDATICQGTSVTLSGSGADTYSWDNSVVDGVSFTPSATLTYQVTGTDANGCENTDQVTITVQDCAGVEEIDGLSFTVYPNPASADLNVNVTNNNGSTIEISLTDINGKVVFNSTLNASNAQENVKIDVSTLSNGVYYLKLNSNASVSTKKVIVQ